jgi:hypothetical protein
MWLDCPLCAKKQASLGLPPMPKHAGKEIAQRDAEHEQSSQVKIHPIIVGRPLKGTLS